MIARDALLTRRAPAARAHPEHAPRTLVVSAETSFARQLDLLLGLDGISCTRTQTAAAAIRELTTPGADFDLVVLDGSVPSVALFRVYSHLRLKVATQALPIVFSRSDFSNDIGPTGEPLDMYFPTSVEAPVIAQCASAVVSLQQDEQEPVWQRPNLLHPAERQPVTILPEDTIDVRAAVGYRTALHGLVIGMVGLSSWLVTLLPLAQ